MREAEQNAIARSADRTGSLGELVKPLLEQTVDGEDVYRIAW